MTQQGAVSSSETQTSLIRRREEADLDECVRVLAEVHHGDGYPVNWPERPREWLMQQALLAAWVAEQDGAVVGHIGLARSGAADLAPMVWSRREGVSVDETAVISRLFVAPAARGNGIGAQLMARAVQDAQERELHPLLDVVATDDQASALYERLGWKRLASVEQRWSPTKTVTVHCYSAPV